MAAREQPSLFRELETADDELDDGVEALERADEVGAVGPGAAVVEVKGVAVLFRGERGGGSGGDGGAEFGSWAAELAVCVGVLVNKVLRRRLAGVLCGDVRWGIRTLSGIVGRMTDEGMKACWKENWGICIYNIERTLRGTGGCQSKERTLGALQIQQREARPAKNCT